MLVDTGSNQLWVTSSQCNSAKCNHKYANTYDIESSTIGRYTGEIPVEDRNVKILTKDKDIAMRKDIQYTVGAVGGVIGMDKVCFDGLAYPAANSL